MPDYTLSKTVTWFDYHFAGGVNGDGVPVILYDELIQHNYNGPYASRVSSSVNTPGYKALVLARKPLPEHEFSRTVRIQEGGLLAITHREMSAGIVYIDTTHRHGNTFHSWDDDYSSSDLENELYLDLLNKIKGTTWQAGVALAEAHKTADMFKKVVPKLVNSVSQLRKGNLFGAALALGGVIPSKRRLSRFDKEFGADAAKAASNAWLELQYGWKPLLKDVKDAADVLVDAWRPDTINRDLVAKKTKTKSFREIRKGYLYEISPPKSGVLTADRDLKVRVTIKYRATPEPALYGAMVGLTNPLSIAWELVPFSFVADWFIPVGDFLSSLDATVGKSFVSGTRASVLNGRYTLSVPGHPAIPSGDTQSGSVSWTRTYKSRSSLLAFPTASLPPFDLKLGVEKAISGLALLRGQLSRLRG